MRLPALSLRKGALASATPCQPAQRHHVAGGRWVSLRACGQHNCYNFPDIDGKLGEIAGTHLPQEKLSPNKSFRAMKARARLIRTDKRYGPIIMDVFQGNLTIPEHLVAREFFLEIKRYLKARWLDRQHRRLAQLRRRCQPQ